MPFRQGDAVMLKVSRVSRAGGVRTTLDQGFVGTVCKITALHLYRVQFENDTRLRLLHESSLERAHRRGPPCPS